MKTLLTIILLMLANTSWAESGHYYDPDRDGEGIFVTTDDQGRLSFGLYTYFDAQSAVHPETSPPAPLLPLTPCHNCPIWYVGNGVYVNDASIGAIYLSVAIDYPNVAQGSLNEAIDVGTYLIERTTDGFDLVVDCNGILHPDMYICNETFHFKTKLIGE